MEKVIVSVSVVVFIVFIALLFAWLISWCVTPFLATFGLPALKPLAVLGLMCASVMFKGFLKLFVK